MSQQIKNTSAHKTEANSTTTPRRVHAPKLTLTRGGILRSTRAGEACRKSFFNAYAVDKLSRHKDFYGYKQTFLIETSLIDSNDDIVYVGMTQGQFKVWTDLVDGVRSRGGLDKKSYVEKTFAVAGEGEEEVHLRGMYWREPGLSMRHPEAVLVVMKLEDMRHWRNIRAFERGQDVRLLRREAEEQKVFSGRERPGW